MTIMDPEQDRLKVEQRLTRVEEKVDMIATNHLPHIQSKVDRIQWLLVTTLISLIFLLLKLYLGA